MSDFIERLPGVLTNGIGPAVQTAGRLADAIDTSPASWADGTWWQHLSPGSWRGVGFVMDSAQNKAGRRIALHEYVYRDTVWAEDLGKRPRGFAIQCFLTGDDVYQQRDRMIAACEEKGEGTLVHPTLGSMQVTLMDFETADRRERGRYVECLLVFVLSGEVKYPGTVAASQTQVQRAASRVMPAATTDIGRQFTSLPVLPTIRAATQPIVDFANMAKSAVNDATRAYNAVRGLVGNFGRYAPGKRGTSLLGDINSALSKAITTRNAVLNAADSLVRIGDRL